MPNLKIAHHADEKIHITWYEDNDEKGNEGLLILCKKTMTSVILNSNQIERLSEVLDLRKKILLKRNPS